MNSFSSCLPFLSLLGLDELDVSGVGWHVDRQPSSYAA